MRAALIALALLAAGCHNGYAKPHGCIEAWNQRENDANRQRVLSDGRQWRVHVSQFVVDHPGPEFTGTGCSYLFFDAQRYRSFSALWEQDGDAHWLDAVTQNGRRRPEQEFQSPNATVTGVGMVAADSEKADDRG